MVAIVPCMVSACARGTLTKDLPRSTTTAFAAVVRSLREEGPRDIAVDVRPLRTDPPAMLASPETRLDVPRQELDARAAVVTAAGLTLGNAEVPPNCAGILMPFSPEDRHRGCPPVDAYVVATALAPRYDSTAAATGPVTPPPGWYLRVLATSIGPHGFSSRVDDYLVAQHDGGWRVIRRYTVSWIE
jgi:hypothetical protein